MSETDLTPEQALAHIMKRADRDHVLVRIICAAALIVVLVLVVAFGQLAHEEARTAVRAAVSTDQLRTTCLASNEARGTERNLWNEIFSLVPVAPTTLTPDQQKAQDAQVAQFKDYLNKNLADRVCPK